ncbi:MAG TPA: AarF/UbiB family protein [Candidatus Ozemobacteraceae bacterium]|nr:AarF/UbiB family protein [Candidatus Ozemobacteraceae bacterium]
MDVTQFLGSMPIAGLRGLVPLVVPGFDGMSDGERTSALQNILEASDLEARRGPVIDQLLTECGVGEVVPGAYARFRSLVLDAVRFMLLRLDRRRLIPVLVGQFLLPADVPTGKRLAELARALPVLHKLGQMIARNEHLEPGFRNALRELEFRPGGYDAVGLVDFAAAELARAPIGAEICWNGEILAEASVGAVLPFEWVGLGGGPGRRGVAKLVKPEAKSRLDQDLPALDALATWLDGRRSLYGDLGIDYIGVLREVRDALAAETDPTCEQRHLREARAQYVGLHGVRIPNVFPFSTPTLTAMERLEGVPLPEIEAPGPIRRDLAARTFGAIVLHPLLSDAATTLIHGDPHAGNLLAIPGRTPGAWEIGLIDWSQAGRLDRRQRAGLRTLMLGFMLGERGVVRGALRALLAAAGPGAALEAHLRTAVGSRPIGPGAAFEAALDLIDRLVIDGFRFPRSLLLFRKAWFALRGVLKQLDPGFDPGICLVTAMGRRLIGDLPRRLVRGSPLGWMAPADAPYISDADLLRLVLSAPAA